ncbi:MAG: hypothetical protein FJZ63_04375 [Chlamydiae bacterium]|nr:hypothetical protein [Chlamydiota bacterium]
MDDISGINPNNSTPPVTPPSSGGGAPPETFAQQVWGFDMAETKQFLSTLANTIGVQIQYELQKAKEASDKLKQSETGNDN